MQFTNTAMLRMILKNQRLMMLAIGSMSVKSGGPCSGYHADKLRQRIIEMESNLDWIAPPSERIGPIVDSGW